MISQELELVQGDSKTYVFTFTEDDLPIDVTGWEILFTLKTNYTDLDASAILQKDYTAPSGADATAGIIKFSLTPTNTNITLGEYYYDFKVKKNATDRETIASGKMRVNFTVTIRN